MDRSSRALRRSFLDFFQRNGHEVVRSSPLVPQNDPTLLFTNAGMVQFKDVFTGREKRGHLRATSSQKCVRAGGKHNDLENVGRTARHHTFFEMLGNFSFGDYFKEGAIVYAWQWLTSEIGLDPKRMIVTVFGGDTQLGLGPDDEARAIWKKVSGFSEERIVGLGMKDNFWMMGDTGPQGPCSEIHFYAGHGAPDLSRFGEEPLPDGSGWIEIWNLVFMQFEKRTKDAPLTPLPRPSIDTGAGLERVAAVAQGVVSNYDTDLLRPLCEEAGALAGKRYPGNREADAISMRVLADHARAASFLIADNVLPSNEGRGYVLRRIMRRAIRHGVRLGLKEGHFRALCERVAAEMSSAYPELNEAGSLIARAVDAEDQSFRRTLDRGLKLLDEQFTFLAGKAQEIPGEVVFKLYDTYGFPADLTRVIAEERGYRVDEAGFDREMEKQRARGDFGGSGEQAIADVYKELRERVGATEFLGNDTLQARARIVALLHRGTPVERVESSEELELITARTPFYGESGGQVGDVGTIQGEGFAIQVTDTQKPSGDLIVHRGKLIRGTAQVGQEALLAVDRERRDAIRSNHSATHLLHLALKEVLGSHVAQKGSLVAPDRLRFDFSHFQPMTEEEKRRVEDLVNDEVRKNIDSRIEIKRFDDARQEGAVALFGEKYGDVVRVMRIGDRSVELCGGTHVRRTGDIGLFKITQEIGIAQGIRRIEAVTGQGAVSFVRRLEEELLRTAERVKAPPFEVSVRVEKLQDELKGLRRELEDAKRKLALGGGGRDLLASAKEIGGMRLLATRVEVADPKAMREVADQLRQKLESGVVVLGAAAEGKVSIVVAVSPDLTDRIHAGRLVGEIAKRVGGRGGGRADFAQAGGPEVDHLDAALEAVPKLLT
jgi:alanyl-tRNA synthetase